MCQSPPAEREIPRREQREPRTGRAVLHTDIDSDLESDRVIFQTLLLVVCVNAIFESLLQEQARQRLHYCS